MNETKRLLAVEVQALVALRRELMDRCDSLRAEYDAMSIERRLRCAETLRAAQDADSALEQAIAIAQKFTEPGNER